MCDLLKYLFSLLIYIIIIFKFCLFNKMENINIKKENFRQFNFENFNQTTEEDVGIVEFVNKVDEAFECVLKHRYSDFLVNEISENGNVTWLKIKSEPETSNEQSKGEIEEQPKPQEQTDQLINEKANGDTKNQTDDNKKNKDKNVLSPELVQDIIKKHFVEQQIIDEEDGVILKDLILKYIDR